MEQAMSFILELETDLPRDALRDHLRRYEPWGHRIDFSNGVSTAELARRTPFADNPLQKLLTVANVIPFETLRGGALLDIGCNSGYNSIHAAAHFGMNVVGLDVSKRHMEVCNFLADLARVKAEFLLGNAETFSRPAAFDVVLHFGTLYHLPNPLLALKTTFDNLKPGGWLALETQTYDHPDDPNLCYFMHMHNNDKTNFWAISESVLIRYMTFIGFTAIDLLLKVSPPLLGEHMNRAILVARKPG
jgi:SAM-dependent methyltransferase